MPQPAIRLTVGHGKTVLQAKTLRRVAVVNGDEPPALAIRLKGSMVDAAVPADVGGRIRRRVQVAA